MPYKLNLKMQAAYGLTSAVTALLVLYIVLSRLEWLTAAIVGVAQFLISGFFTEFYKKKCK
jgi:hypothetical protein